VCAISFMLILVSRGGFSTPTKYRKSTRCIHGVFLHKMCLLIAGYNVNYFCALVGSE
jgi:hypothetical protein